MSVEPELFHVTLVKELIGDPLGQLVLDLPRLGDGADVTGRHHHAAQHWKRRQGKLSKVGQQKTSASPVEGVCERKKSLNSRKSFFVTVIKKFSKCFVKIRKKEKTELTKKERSNLEPLQKIIGNGIEIRFWHLLPISLQRRKNVRTI